MKQIVVKCGRSVIDAWVSHMSGLLPEFEVLPFTSDRIRTDDVLYAVGWKPDALWVNAFPKIKALAGIGSGVDHIKNLSLLRADIPVLRTVSPDLAQKMTEFVSMCVLSWHRRLPEMLKANEKREWRVFDSPLASERTVGIMGYGRMGTMVSAALSALGFNVKIWSKSPREGLPYPYYYGSEQLHAFASGCDVLVCLLPLTAETEGLIDYALLRMLNQGACLINAARGSHLIEPDLLRALDEKHLSFAYLDVLSQEPMPATDPIWERDDLIITYHCAAYISAEAGAEIIAGNIRSYEKGNYSGPVYNAALGY